MQRSRPLAMSRRATSGVTAFSAIIPIGVASMASKAIGTALCRSRIGGMMRPKPDRSDQQLQQ
jgi:hypothetical protein